MFEQQKRLHPFGMELVTTFAEAVSDTGQQELQRLFRKDGLLVIRGLNLSMEQQTQLCQAFGPVPESMLENFYVSNRRADGFLGLKELQWHNDVPYLPSPYLVGALHAVEVEPGATSTKFASCMLAYEALSAPLRQRIEGLNALQVKQRVSDRPNRLEDLQPGDLCTVHAVVGKQEGTGRPYLFVNENMTASLIGMPRAESDALLAELFTHLYSPEFVYEHVWQPGDLVVWDNLAVQHARGRIASSARTLQRVTCTRFTYPQQYPTDLVGQELANTHLELSTVADS